MNNVILKPILSWIMRLSVCVNNLTSKMFQMSVSPVLKDAWNAIMLKLASLATPQKASSNKEGNVFVGLVSMMIRALVWLVSEVAKFVRIKKIVQLALMKSTIFQDQIQHVYATNQNTLSMTGKIAFVNLVFILIQSKISVKNVDWAVVSALLLMFVHPVWLGSTSRMLSVYAIMLENILTLMKSARLVLMYWNSVKLVFLPLNAQHASQIRIGTYRMELALVTMDFIQTKLLTFAFNASKLVVRNVTALMNAQFAMISIIG